MTVMKNIVPKITLFALLTSSLYAVSLIKRSTVVAQTSFPISWISFNIGFENKTMLAQFVVPDFQTTKPMANGLRRYDAHIAKMFELTYYECTNQQEYRDWNVIRWQYYAGGRDIDMGRFNISCSLADDIAIAYGLGRSEITPVSYYRANDTIEVQKLNIVGEKISAWLMFTQSFKPS